MANNKIIDLNALQEFLAKCDIRYQATLVSGTNIKTINNTTLLGSGNYAFDSEFSEVSTNALQNQVISKEIREINYELAVIRESLFETTLTEIDYEEQWATLYTIPETLTDNDGTHRLVYSETQLKMAKGNSVVVNNHASTTSFSDVTTSANVFTRQFTNDLSIIGHKYIAIFDLQVEDYTKISYVKVRYPFASNAVSITNNNKNRYYILGEADGTNQFGLQLTGITGSGISFDYSNVQFIDLTQEFPINTPTSVDDVRVKWLIAQSYIAYNSGTLASTTISGLKIRGFNQWDEQWENGSYNTTTGEKQNDTNVRCKNFIDVKPNTTYRWFVNKTYSYATRILFYDNQYRFLGETAFVSNNSDFTTPANALYMTFYLNNNYGTTYNKDICINISNASLNGTYKSSVEYIISVPQTTLRSASSVQDYIEVVDGDIVEGEQLYNVVKHVLMGAYTFTGNESWTEWVNGSYYADCSLNAKNNDNASIPNALMYIGTPVSINDIYNHTTANGYSVFNNRVYLSSELYTNRASLTGKTINYELATQTTETIATNLHFDQVSALIEQGGTIEPIYTDVPCDLTTTFVVKKAVGE